MAFSAADLQNSFGNYSFRGSSSSNAHMHEDHQQIVVAPHQGSLCRVEGRDETTYVLEILLGNDESAFSESEESSPSTHELVFLRKDFEFSLRLFHIMDTESSGLIVKATVEEFMALRCPVFWRRDEDLQHGGRATDSSVNRGGTPSSPTFEEVWNAVVCCSTSQCAPDGGEPMLGVEGWMVFCRFIALAQYLEAKRRFSGRHLQQTMRHRNAPRGSELVVVNVPPVAPPIRLTARELAKYERDTQTRLPLPELDLDHSLLAAHDVLRRRRKQTHGEYAVGDRVKIELFGQSPLLLSSNASSSSSKGLEFCLTLLRSRDRREGMILEDEATTVRRSVTDIKWLHDTFVSHKALGGTLCGRILPPFPGNQLEDETSVFPTTTGGAIAAATHAGKEFAHAGVGIAAAGVGMLTEGFRSLWSGYGSTADGLLLSSSTSSKKHPTESSLSKTKSNPASIRNTMKTYYNPNSPIGKARHLERYLNYLLEHPALSTSFPLNTILKASQSGLDAAKQSLEEHTRAAREINEQTPKMDDGKTSTFWSLQGQGGSMPPNLTWVRTAAQAAVALQLHGVLETTGLSSASARLQHASLPTFNNSRNPGWADETETDRNLARNNSDENPEQMEGDSFEEGVLHVGDELASSKDDDNCIVDQEDGDGYDLLPLPVPAPERQILNVGESTKRQHSTGSKKEARFRYGAPPIQEGLVVDGTEDDHRVYLGEMAIDENIDKLREVIGSVDNTLSRCSASSCGIERSRRERFALNLDILRGLDSWEGLRGKFVSQRALLKGLSGMEQSREVFEESDLTLIDDVSWQSALAHSAVSAAEDVRSTVRAARTGSNAKLAAVKAAHAAKSLCEKGKFANVHEARAAQTRASIAQSHAIHAAVVEHEAKTVKRRATLALAHDVKCWNVHRKREVLKICLDYAKSQHEGTRRAVDAWSCLRDGYVGSTIIPSTQHWKASTIPERNPVSEEPEVKTTIYNHGGSTGEGRKSIVAVEHRNLKLPIESLASKKEPKKIEDTDSSSKKEEPDQIVSLAFATPIPEETEEIPDDGDKLSLAPGGIILQPSEVDSNTDHEQSEDDQSRKSTLVIQSSASSDRESSEETAYETENNEALTNSMQSLVDGLMNWGGIDVEDNFALPTGMAASIALEESIAFGNSP
ncbi:unnamed protein product [Pseudo-nitzschia multistriata]|uniref:PX domain-containing protein n=1 Tax=Pseudo-nitzschia multistriata TaxID=183589 RepID=A0A448YWW2_9STRA|nr:unnamed protein product [Pseudo-nitzschia multistriata]